MTKLQDLLIAAGSVANNCTSATHRAIACRALDRLGEEWTAGLSAEQSLLIAAIAASVRALAAVTTPEARQTVAASLSGLVSIARERPPSRKPAQPAERRLYWIEADR